jgi:hypothetical protein
MKTFMFLFMWMLLDGGSSVGEFPGHSQSSTVKFWCTRQNSYVVRIFPDLFKAKIILSISMYDTKHGFKLRGKIQSGFLLKWC